MQGKLERAGRRMAPRGGVGALDAHPYIGPAYRRLSIAAKLAGVREWLVMPAKGETVRHYIARMMRYAEYRGVPTGDRDAELAGRSDRAHEAAASVRQVLRHRR